MRGVDLAAGTLLVALPIAFNAAFAALAATFDYPDILRRPTGEVLARFRGGGTRLVLLWWAFAMTAVAVVPLAVLLDGALDGADADLRAVAATTGVLAAAVQFLGLVRWPLLVPYLARVDADPTAGATRHEVVDVIFQAFNRYLGVAVGEHLGYLLTGAWSILTGVAMIPATSTPTWLGLAGIAIGALLVLCSLEFVGPAEPEGWRLAGRLTPVAYVAWSAWLITTGIVLLR